MISTKCQDMDSFSLGKQRFFFVRFFNELRNVPCGTNIKQDIRLKNLTSFVADLVNSFRWSPCLYLTCCTEWVEMRTDILNASRMTCATPPPQKLNDRFFFFRNHTNTNHSQASRTTLVLEKLLDGYDKRLRPNFGGNVPWYCYTIKKRKRFSRLNSVTIKKTQGDASGFNRIRAHGPSNTSATTWSHWKWQLDIFLVKMCV